MTINRHMRLGSVALFAAVIAVGAPASAQQVLQFDRVGDAFGGSGRRPRRITRFSSPSCINNVTN